MRSLFLKGKYLGMILDGTKSLEGRVGYENIKNIKRNDQILFNGRYKARILRVSRYTTFKEALSKEDFKKLIPDVDSQKESLQLYESLFPLWKQEKLGVYIFEFKLIK